MTLIAPLPPVETVRVANAGVLASVRKLLAGDDTNPVFLPNPVLNSRFWLTISYWRSAGVLKVKPWYVKGLVIRVNPPSGGEALPPTLSSSKYSMTGV